MTFLVGLGLGWRTIHDPALATTGATVIAPSNLDQLVLMNPFPARQPPAEARGSLRMWLYSNVALDEPSVAEGVHPVAFDLETPWLKTLLAEKLTNRQNIFSVRMRGQIYLPARVNHLHLKSDNGYRVRLRDAQGKEARVENWLNEVTEDFYFQVTAEPGCYEIEIDFTNIQGGAFFDLWSESKDIAFYPAEPAADKPAP